MNSSDILNLFSSQTIGTSSIQLVLFSVVLAFAVGLGIAAVYRMNFRGVMYSSNFTLTLVLMTLITTPVVMCIGSNIALSMGMVGALSIVRFRTAVKDPMDTAYMFWALTMGILLGAGLYLVALVVVAGIGLTMLVLSFVRMKSPNTYLLVVHYDEDVEPDVNSTVARIRNRRLRSKVVSRGGVELTVEVQLGERSDIVNRMLDIEGVHNATLIACQSEAGN